MQQRELGKTGLTVSALGFGCGAVGGLMVEGEPSEQRQAVERALDAGITYFDTAASYGDGKSETNLGRVLKELNAWQRVVVGTKVRLSGDGSPRAEIREALEQSLRRLDHDSVDVFHLHNPIVHERGLELDAVLGEVARGFEDVIAAGMTRHAGFTAPGSDLGAGGRRSGRRRTRRCRSSSTCSTRAPGSRAAVAASRTSAD